MAELAELHTIILHKIGCDMRSKFKKMAELGIFIRHGTDLGNFIRHGTDCDVISWVHKMAELLCVSSLRGGRMIRSMCHRQEGPC